MTSVGIYGSPSLNGKASPEGTPDSAIARIIAIIV